MKLLAYLLFLLCAIHAYGQDEKEKKIYLREDFKKMFAGKTEEEVVKELGKANRISNRPYLGSTMRVLEYDGIVQDKNAKEVDESTWVWFYSTNPNDPTKRANRFTIGKKPR